MYRNWISGLLMLGLLATCDTQSLFSDVSNLPPARGEIGEIIMVIDSVKRGGPVGLELRRIFTGVFPGLPQDEPAFTVRYVAPRSMNNVLRNAKNLIFVATLDDESLDGQYLLRSFTQKSKDRINNDPSLYMLSKPDEFARGQEVLHLFGKNDAELLNNIRKNRTKIRNHFELVEKKRLLQVLYAKEVTGISQTLLRDSKYTIRIPFGYELAQVKDNFAWIRQIDEGVDKMIFIYYEDYTSAAVFEENNVLDFRNTITKTHLRDIEYKHVHVTTQTVSAAPFETIETNFNQKYALETRGLWKLSDDSRGGPFLSYTFVDKELNRLYYIEGMVDSPGNLKRDFMREIEVILSTFRTEAEVSATESDQTS